MRRLLGSRALRTAFALVAVALLLYAVATSWPAIRPRLRSLSPGGLSLSLALVVAGLFASLLSWRAVVADLGSPLAVGTASRIFFLGQLGKYLPGSVWPVVAQMELGTDAAVPRRRSAAAALVIYAVNIFTGALVAALTLPIAAAGSTAWSPLSVLALPAGLVLLHPRVVNPLLNRGLRMLRREPLEHPLTGRGLLAAGSWATTMWVCYGLHVLVLARDVGGTGVRLLPLAVGGFALAWVTGFLVVVAPAGAGAREAALVLALGGALTRSGALTVALVSRLLMTLGDLFWGGLALGRIGSARLRTLRARPPETARPAGPRP